MISHLEGQKSAEILMEALGPNLRKLLKQCPGNIFTKTTVYMITIQLVSHFEFNPLTIYRSNVSEFFIRWDMCTMI